MACAWGRLLAPVELLEPACARLGYQRLSRPLAERPHLLAEILGGAPQLEFALNTYSSSRFGDLRGTLQTVEDITKLNSSSRVKTKA